MDELGKRKKIQCKDGIKWDITVEVGESVYTGPYVGENAKFGSFILSCKSDGGEEIFIPSPKPLDMMKDQELCDLIESKQSKS